MRVVLDEVRLAFGARLVLHDVSLAIGPGQSIALMGPSGSGKSSLLALMAGLLAPTSGSRRIEDDRPGDDGSTRFAWVMQTTPLLMRRTVADNVQLAARCQGSGAAESAKRGVTAMSALGIADLAGTPVHKLSGGERQRVSIARAVATDAPFVLADEPTAALDATNRDLVTSALLAAVSPTCSVIVATHDPAVADRCAVVVRLANGVLIDG